MNRRRLEASATRFTVVGALILAVGLLLDGEFLWLAPDLVSAINEAAQTGHLTLVLLGTLYSAGPTVGSTLIGGLGGALLTTVGILLLRARRGTRFETDGKRRVKSALQ